MIKSKDERELERLITVMDKHLASDCNDNAELTKLVHAVWKYLDNSQPMMPPLFNNPTFFLWVSQYHTEICEITSCTYYEQNED